MLLLIPSSFYWTAVEDEGVGAGVDKINNAIILLLKLNCPLDLDWFFKQAT